jgi:hypothetical protein
MAQVRFYQTNAKTGENTFNLLYEVNNFEQFDYTKFAAMMANKLIDLQELANYAQSNGQRLGFSLTKPMWFEYNNGRMKIQASEYVARQFNSFIKMKRGKEQCSKTQIKASILIALKAMQIFVVEPTAE